MKNLLRIAPILLVLQLACTKKEALTSIESNASGNSVTATANGIVAWYTFNGDILDHSKFHNDVVSVTNAKAVPGKNGLPNTAYFFSGHSYMVAPNHSSLNPRHEITMAVTIKPMGFYQGLCHANRVLHKGQSDQSYGAYFIGFDDGYYYNYQGCSLPVKDSAQTFYASYGNDQYHSVGARDTSDYLKANRWYNIVYTVDSNKIGKLYINGKLKATAHNPNADFRGNLDDLYIGRMNNSQYPYWFTGIIDEIRIYNKALSPDVINSLDKEMGK